MARALLGTVTADRLTVVVNVGDDDSIYGAYVSADLDTIVYTLAGIEGPHGWGRANDTFAVMQELTSSGVDTSFRLGDKDLATCLRRTAALESGVPLSAITGEIARSFDIQATVLPATDDPLRTRVQVEGGSWLSFQEYFVGRHHQDTVAGLDYHGAEACHPAPGVLKSIERADLVVIAPSNPPLSIWPILAIPGIHAAVASAACVAAISPLFGGTALKGPADKVMSSLGMPPGTAGVLQAYEGLLTALVIDNADAADQHLSTDRTTILAADTRIADAAAGRRFAAWLLDTMLP